MTYCKVFSKQPCSKKICCKECSRYDKCGYGKCENHPKLCGGTCK